MIQHVLSSEVNGFDWYDITHPSEGDFHELATRYNLHESTIRNCLEVGHLPKIEVYPDYQFLILRSIAAKYPEHSDVLIELTERISIFYGDKFIITVHRAQIEWLDKIKQTPADNAKLKGTKHVVNLLVSQALKTFEHEVIYTFADKIDQYEEFVFLHSRRKPFMKKLYYLKRQIDLIRIILTLYQDLVEYFHIPERVSTFHRNLHDLYKRTDTLYRNLAENTSQLLSMYFNIESNHTNEIMRTLTIISVFFMPLTFVVGVYGMNFVDMPELEWKYGYPAVLLFMLLLSLAIYFWFKKKRWL